MKSINELLIDIVYEKKRSLELYVEELELALGENTSKDVFINHEIKEKNEESNFLDDLKRGLISTNDGIKYIKEMIKKESNDSFYKISKKDILKTLIKEYKIEYKKNYWDNKKVGLSGVFDNDLFCEIIKKKILMYTNCNRVTVKKYVHLTAFLNELLCEMENSDNPLKTLKHKMNIYSRYKNSEYVEIRSKKIRKSEVLKQILAEYNKLKKEQRISAK